MTIDDTAPDRATRDHDPSVGEFQLEERSSLRRVVGLSTELQDVNDAQYRQLRL
ncbi:MAG: GTPase HflX, partial [Dietzia cercidiphylli]